MNVFKTVDLKNSSSLFHIIIYSSTVSALGKWLYLKFNDWPIEIIISIAGPE